MKVLLLCDYLRTPDRRLLVGLFNYANELGGWDFVFNPVPIFSSNNRRKSEEIIELAKSMKVDAIFGRWEKFDQNAVKKLGIPVIIWISGKIYPTLPKLIGEYRNFGKMAAQFFLRQHYTSYAFLGYKKVLWSEERMKGFFDALPDEHYHRSFLRVEKNHQDWNSVRKWLESLKKPTAMMVANDALGMQLIQTCKEIGLNVPDDIAIIGVDNDEFLCTLYSPALTSIDPNFEKQGYELGQVIWKMHSEGRIWPARILLEPIGLVERSSTKPFNIADRYISQIVKKMDEEYTKPNSLDYYLANIPLSRRAIEKNFKAALAPDTPLSYLTKLRIKHLCWLLDSTDLSISEAAEKSGFVDIPNLSRIFKKHTGMSPSAYRKKRN